MSNEKPEIRKQLSLEEIQNIEGYLAKKFGIELPEDHPYKNKEISAWKTKQGSIELKSPKEYEPKYTQ
jgi:hypothetical protein